MQARAIARYVRLSPKKAQQTAALIRGKNVNNAINILMLTNKKAARLILKVLRSAVANYRGRAQEYLRVKEVAVDCGGMLKRVWARARGRTSLIRHRLSHIKVVVDDGA